MPRHIFSVTERVRWSDLDPANVVYFGTYVRYLEIAELELARHLGLPYGTLFDTHDIWLPRVEFHMNFHGPARHDDLLRIDIWVAHVGTTSIRLDFEILRDADRVSVATGHVAMVCVDRTTFSPIDIPPDIRRRLESFQATGEG